MGISALVYRAEGKAIMVLNKKFSFFYSIVFLFFCSTAVAQDGNNSLDSNTFNDNIIDSGFVEDSVEIVETDFVENNVVPVDVVPVSNEFVEVDSFEIDNSVVPDLPVANQGLPEATTFPEAELPLAEVEIAQGLPQEVATEIVASRTKAKEITLGKSDNDSGFVVISLEDSVSFELSRTAPSEYILSIPGVDISSDSDSLNSPLVAPKGLPGIRSVRATQELDSLKIRMFVDANVDLQAYPRGKEILVEAIPLNLSKDPSSRAQLSEEDSGQGANVDL